MSSQSPTISDVCQSKVLQPPTFIQRPALKLLWGTSGIYVSFFAASLLDEKIFKTPYKSFQDPTQQHIFVHPILLVVMQTLFSFLMCRLLNAMANKPRSIPLLYAFKTSLLHVSSCIAFNTAMMYMAFPLCLLLKSCNLLSVIVVGVFCTKVQEAQGQKQKLGSEKLVVGVIVSLGIIMFYCGNNINPFHVDQGTSIGIALLLFCLICDGFEVDFKAEIKQKFKPSPLQMLQIISLIAFFLSLSYLLITKQASPIWAFIQESPSLILDIFTESITTSIGYMFFFYIISNFQQHVAPLIVTTRKIISAVISILVFKHQISLIQWMGLCLVFLGTVTEFLSPFLVERYARLRRYKQYTMI